MPAVRYAIAAGALLAVGAGAASAASWSTPQFPRANGVALPALVAVGRPMALAQSPNGSATLLYRGANNGIYAISRPRVNARWGSAATWLPARRARAGGALEAGMAGSRVWAMWTQSGNRRLATTTGTRSVGGRTPLRATNLPSRGVPPAFDLVNRSYGMTMAQTGAAYGGPVPVGRVPRFAPQQVAASTTGSSYAINAAGQQVALLFDGTNLSWSSRSAGVGWSAASAAGISPQIAIGYSPLGATPPSDVAIDAAGNAAITWVAFTDAQGTPIAPGGSPAGAAVMLSTRPAGSASFGTPSVVARLPAPPSVSAFLGGVAPQVTNLQVAMGGNATAVSWMTMGDGPPLLWATIGATGGVLPAPTQLPDPEGLQQAAYDGNSYVMSVNTRGMAAVAFGWAMSMGEVDGLFATTSAGPGQPWAPLREVSGCANRPQGGGGGYGDIQLMPFTSGFTLAFNCTTSNSSTTRANSIGITTYR